MSYPQSLDEYPDKTIKLELDRRTTARAAGNCSYCGRPQLQCQQSSCQYPNNGEPR